MSAQTQHTPGPFAIGQTTTHTGPSGRNIGTRTDLYSKTTGAKIACMLPSATAEDRAFIVRACNAHAELLDALRGLLKTFDECHAQMPRVMAARAAIAKATQP